MHSLPLINPRSSVRCMYMGDIISKIPPHNLEAEESLLGSIFVDQESLAKVMDVVNEDDFYKESHRIIFEVMLDLFEKHEPIDVLTVGNRLEEKKQLSRIGGRTALVEITNRVTTSAHVANYGKIIQKKATLRRLLSAASKIT